MNWPEQKVVARLTAQYATKLKQAFKSAIDGDAIARSWAETHPAGGSVSPQTARDWALAHAVVNQKPLQYALSRIYADGYTLGVKVAQARLTGLKKGVTANVVDWSTWKPGLPSAAALVKPMGGLKELLDSQKITIANEITRTKLDRIGTALSTSLSRGDTAKETAKAIDAIIADPQHALVIARTEMARAMSVASREQYQNAGVEQVEWLVAEGCADCQENADASPIPLGDEFPTGDTEPPAHPNCMCAIAPVFDDSALPPEGNVPEELPPEDFASTSEDFATAAIAESMVAEQLTTANVASTSETWNPITADRWIARQEAERTKKGFTPMNDVQRQMAQDQIKDVRVMYEKGPHVIRVDKTATKVTDEHVTAFMKNFDEVIAKLPEWRKIDENGLQRSYTAIITPLKTNADAYTYMAHDTIWFAPKDIVSTLGPLKNYNGYFMPAADTTNTNLYTIAHEMGHTIDSNLNNDLKRKVGAALKRKYPQLWSRYSRTNINEGYAEVFAQWMLGEQTAVTEAYAEKFGWNLTAQEYKAQIEVQWKPSGRAILQGG